MAEDKELQIACLETRPARCLLRYAGLFVGCLSVGVAFCFDLFSIYGQTLKETFAFSQKELALTTSLANLGMIAALPMGILVQKYDPRWLSGGSFVVSTLSCALILGTTYHVDFYKENFYILGIFYFALGCAGGSMYMTALVVNLRNFPRRHTAVVSGIVHCARSIVLGALLLIYSYVYGTAYVLPTPEPTSIPPSELNQKKHMLREFFQFMLLTYGGVNFLACIFYGDYRDDQQEGEPASDDSELVPIRSSGHNQYGTTQLSDSEGSSRPSTDDATESVRTPPVTASDNAALVTEEDSASGVCPQLSQLLQNKVFHLLLWPSVLLLGLRNAFIGNLSVVLATYNLNHFPEVVYAVPLVGTVAPPLIGLIGDRTGSRLPQSAWYMLAAGGLLGLYLADMGFAGILPVLIVSVVWSEFSSACVHALGPSLHIEQLGSASFPTGWGALTLLMTLVTLIMQIIMGAIYDLFTPDGAILCEGFRCYIAYFFLCALVTYACVVCLFFLIRHEVENRRTQRK